MTNALDTSVESLDFDLEYDGPALIAHEMDVRDLAPALLGTADLFQTLNRRLNPTGREVSVNIRATNEGSFLIQLKLAYDAYTAAFTSPALIATEGLGFLLTSAAGIVRFVKQRGRAGEPTAGPTPVADGMVRIEWSDGTTLEVPENVPRLADDTAVRNSLARLVSPIASEGIDAVRFLRDEEIVAEVVTEDLAAFQPDGTEVDRNVVSSSEREVQLGIMTSAWQVGRKWRFSDGRWPFWAAITDDNFNERLISGERFGSHDILRCIIREEQWRDDTGLHTEITVLEVLERLEGPQQLTFQ